MEFSLTEPNNAAQVVLATVHIDPAAKIRDCGVRKVAVPLPDRKR